MNNIDMLRAQINELVHIKAQIFNNSCMMLPWDYEYNESDGIKEQMARFINLQTNRQRARLGVIEDIDKRIDLMRAAIE